MPQPLKVPEEILEYIKQQHQQEQQQQQLGKIIVLTPDQYIVHEYEEGETI